jgi:hypothetical protein
MMTATIERTSSSLVTTDNVRAGCTSIENLTTTDRSLRALAADPDGALSGDLWSVTLKAELEEAFDSALLRAAIADLPRLSGAHALTWW